MSITLNEKTLLESIKAAIEKELDAEYDNIRKEFLEKLEKRKNEIIAGMLVNLTKNINVQSINENLIVTIKEVNTNDIK